VIKELVCRNRSYRRFYEDESIEEQTLRNLVDLARLAATGRNLQPLKYILSCDAQKNGLIFPQLSWAGYLGGWKPAEGERPSAYIVMLGDKDIAPAFGIDPGIAAQNILLGAVEMGLGGCMITSIRRIELSMILDIPERYEILLVIALGIPREVVQIEPLGENGDVKYWRDEAGVHHLPKRALDEIIIA
jgi:nitroreductase